MRLLANGTLPLMDEKLYIKDGVARLVVEMIKREWPQQWPGLLDELNELCSRGETQTELVLLVLLRLAEDVATLQTLESNQRRKDIYQALTANMETLFKFFLWLINRHFTKLQDLVAIGAVQALEESKVHSKVCEVVLTTLGAYVEWVATSHLVAEGGQLLQMLCLLLKNKACEDVQLAAAECLYLIVNRKGTVEERRPLLVLFSPDAMSCMFEAAHNAITVTPTDSNYLFLKKLTQVLTGLGSQIHYLLGKDESTGIPENFGAYLSALMHLSQHPSLQITHYANQLWTSFFKHDVISKNPEFLKFVTLWIASTVPKDFDSDEEFSAFFHRYRAELQEAIHQATLIAPLDAFAYIEKCLTLQLSKPVVGMCTTQSPDAIEWEALNHVVEAVLSRILLCRDRPPVVSGLRLLQMCLNYETKDPLLASFVLSSISALFVFLSMDPSGTSMLPLVLQKIFAALVFTQPGQTKESRSRAVKNVRRHAASLMVKLAQRYPLLLLPMFDDICATVRELSKDPDQLSQLERVTLQEALLLVSNHFCDYERQTAFVAEVISAGAQQWMGMKDAFANTENFMAFVGLDKPPVEPSTDDVNGKNRSQIMFCMKLFFAIVRRCAWPDDPERLSKGGFVAGFTPSGNPIHRNPAAPHLLPLLPHLMALCRTLNALFRPDSLERLSEGYKKAHDMLETYRNNALGLATGSSVVEALLEVQKAQTPLERMQYFLSLVHESCYLILGAAGPTLGHSMYTLPGLSAEVVATSLSNLDCIPDYRLRPIIRVFLKAFISALFLRLNERWQQIGQLYEIGESGNSDNTDAQSCEDVVLDDNLNRLLTREYLDLLRAVLIGSGGASCVTDTDSMDVTAECGTASGGGRPAAVEVMSDLGLFTLRNDVTCEAISFCILRALSWNDNAVAMKAAQLALPLVRQLMAEGNMTEQGAIHIMCSVLHGLEAQGDQEGNPFNLVFLGGALYDLLRPHFPALKGVLLQIPHCDLQEVEKLDEKIFNTATKGSKRDKLIREAFKKLTLRLVGQEVSRLFRKEVSIKNLPPLMRKSKVRPAVEDAETSDIGLSSLFQPSSEVQTPISH
ncbi:hypothetical protein B566_EDAN003889 [Ephemera danica]|nr:hypothetical protein B566_EDAN003889 [Ephemera danica]